MGTPSTGNRLRSAGARLLLWVAAAAASWWFLVVVELVAVARGAPDPRALLAAFELAALFALPLGGGLFLYRALSAALRHLAPRRGPLVALALPLVLAAPAAWLQAAFLTSGDGVTASGYAPVLRAVFLLALLLATLALTVWHWTLTPPDEAPAPRSRGWTWAVGLLGLVAAAGLFALVAFSLQYYAYFARGLILPLGVVAASLLFRLVPRGRAALTGAALVVVAGAAALLHGPVSAAAVAARDSRLSRYVVTTLRVAPEAASFRVNVDDAARFRCDAPAPPRLQPLPLSEERRRNVILISVDALRRDVTERARPDGAGPLTPALNAFAAGSVAFPRAQTPYPATVFALGSALSGLSPSELLFAPRPPPDLVERTQHRFDRRVATLPTSGWFKPLTRTLRARDVEVEKASNAAAQTDDFIARLTAAREAGARTFAWLHYFDPHKPYRAHAAHDFGASSALRYASEVAFLDEHFGRLAAYLEDAGWYEDSLVIFFADHGQALGERSYTGHHVFLNGWIADVPLFLRAPGLAPRVDPGVVTLPDIAPTVLHFMGVAAPAGLVGQSLLTPIPADRAVVSEAFPIRGSALFQVADAPVTDLAALGARIARVSRAAKNYEPKVSLVDAEHRLIVERHSGIATLFARADEGETRDLSGARPERYARMRARLEAWHRAQSERVYCRARAAFSRR